jgi:uncharacterized SAM-binding protein YcdF (DUF218 family)
MAAILLSAGFLLLYLLSTPAVARRLAAAVEGGFNPMPGADLLQTAGAIVVPGCDRYANAPEHGGRDAVSACTLVRLAHAAGIHRATGLPILVSGGRVFGEAEAEAELMERALRSDFNVEATWLETQSRNTAGNARHSAVILKTQGIGTIVLVTHAVHMRRAAESFRRQGIEVVPAPAAFYSAPDSKPLVMRFLPSMTALSISHVALYEMLGGLWYRVRGA